MSLEEHQTAIELIMSKYREHILKLAMSRKMEDNLVEVENGKVHVGTCV